MHVLSGRHLKFAITVHAEIFSRVWKINVTELNKGRILWIFFFFSNFNMERILISFSSSKVLERLRCIKRRIGLYMDFVMCPAVVSWCVQDIITDFKTNLFYTINGTISS